jgi:ABC-type glycerol-3-phosphate transport system permease component
MTMVPPAFYPSEAVTADFAIPAAGRFIESDGYRWVAIAESPDLTEPAATPAPPGAYRVRLDADGPSRLVRWFPSASATTPLTNLPPNVVFAGRPLVRVSGRPGRLVQVARMTRERDGRVDEWLFVVPPDGSAARVEILHNPRYSAVRAFKPRWRNYPETLAGPESTFGAESEGGFLLYMRNSFLISLLAVVGQVFSSSLVAYGFSRLQFKGRDALFVVLLATLMVPGQVTLIPLFAIYRQLGWVDTFLPLIVPHFTAGAFNVFLLRQYMLTIPRALDEAAAMDGCSPVGTYWRVILPNCVPALIVVALFTFVYTWQDVMGPLIYLDNPALRTVTLGLEYFRSPYVDNRHLIMTGAVLAMAPVALVFLVLQRHIMAGVATTGIKG